MKMKKERKEGEGEEDSRKCERASEDYKKRKKVKMGGEEKEERGEATCSIYRTEEERSEGILSDSTE